MRTMKEKNYTINGKKYSLLTDLIIDAKGNKWADTIFIDYCIKGLKIAAKVCDGTPNKDHWEIASESMFKGFKRYLDKKYPNVLIVLNNPCRFVSEKSISELQINFAFYYQPKLRFENGITFFDKYKDDIVQVVDEVVNYIKKEFE